MSLTFPGTDTKLFLRDVKAIKGFRGLENIGIDEYSFTVKREDMREWKTPHPDVSGLLIFETIRY